MTDDQLATSLLSLSCGLAIGLLFFLAMLVGVRSLFARPSMVTTWFLLVARSLLAGLGFWWVAQAGAAISLLLVLSGFLAARSFVQWFVLRGGS